MVVRLLCIGILLLIFSCDRKDDNYEDLLLNNYTRVKFPKLEYDKVDYYVFDDRLTDLDSLRLVSNYEYSFIDTLGNIYNTIKPKYKLSLTRDEISFLKESLRVYTPKKAKKDTSTLATDCAVFYRDVLVWKDKNDKPIAAFEMCFTCGKYNFYPKISDNVKIITQEKVHLGSFFYKISKALGENSYEEMAKSFFLTSKDLFDR